MLHPLSAKDLDKAMELLVEGFPERPRAFWEKAVERLRQHGGNAAADHPYGFIWITQGRQTGVALTPAVARVAPCGATRRLVNISSWYVRPDQRWRAALMLKSLLSDPEAIYTDLTPTPAVRKMLPSLGFRPINRGTHIAPIPIAALRRSGGTLATVATDAAAAAITGHAAVGCEPVRLAGPSGETLVVYRGARRFGVPVANLVYVESHRALAAAYGALARHLLARGFAFMRAPALDEPAPFGSALLPTGIWYVRGDYFEDRTDVVGSELTLFDF